MHYAHTTGSHSATIKPHHHIHIISTCIINNNLLNTSHIEHQLMNNLFIFYNLLLSTHLSKYTMQLPCCTMICYIQLTTSYTPTNCQFYMNQPHYISSTFFFCKSNRSTSAFTSHNHSARNLTPSLQTTASRNYCLLLHLPVLKQQRNSTYVSLKHTTHQHFPSIDPLPLHMNFIPYLVVLPTYFY
jgi:hypothetical protein